MLSTEFTLNCKGFLIVAESLADYVRRVMHEKEFTFKSVSDRSHGAVSAGGVNEIVQGRSTNPTIATLKGLAKGLMISEEAMFAVARGLTPDALPGKDLKSKELSALFYDYEDLDEAGRQELQSVIDFLHAEIRRRKLDDAPPRTKNKTIRSK